MANDFYDKAQEMAKSIVEEFPRGVVSVFRASNGIGVQVDQGRVVFTDPNTPTAPLTLSSGEMRALREFFQYERDEELGRWRWPENPDYVVYPTMGQGKCIVTNERDAERTLFSKPSATGQSSKHRAARAYFAAHPDPLPEGVVRLNYDYCKSLPVGTTVVYSEGYWKGCAYVKTGESTWAYFKSRPEANTLWRAVDRRENNLSPCPSSYYLAHVYAPPERPKTWHDAKEGEVWVLTTQEGESSWFVNGHYFQNTRTLTNVRTTDEAFTAGRRLWPEVDGV